MATTKKTTTTKTTTKKAPAKKTTKPKLEVVKEEPVKEYGAFELMAARFPFEQKEVDLGDGLVVHVRNRLGLGEMMTVVRNIVDACTDEERGEVYFELFEYVAKMTICAVYCNEIAPENNEIGYLAVCSAGGFYDKIEPYMDEEQIDTIWSTARERLESKRDMFVGAAAKITIDMLQRLNELYDMTANVAEDFDGKEAVEAVKKLSVLTTGK